MVVFIHSILAGDCPAVLPDVSTATKVWVSYFGSSFAGWARQPNRKSVEGTVAAAVAAAGLTGVCGSIGLQS